MALRPKELATGLRGRDLLTLMEYTSEEVDRILDLAAELKALAGRGEYPKLLQGKSVGMIFQKPSTRTRVSFEVGIRHLGGQPLVLSATEMQLGRGETVEDTGRVLSRYLDAIVIRTFAQDTLERLAASATIPVINGLTDSCHPCQAMADLLTIAEIKGREMRGLRLAYVGDGNNVCHSLMVAGTKVGMEVRVATPPGYEPDPRVRERVMEAAAAHGGRLRVGTDPVEAVLDADVVYTDTWTSMGQEEESSMRGQLFAPYQVNEELMAKADGAALFMHCLPAHRGEEVTSEVIDGPRSVVWDEAENRLHVQKAILALLV